MNAEDVAADLAARFGLRKRSRSWGGDCPACSYHGAFSMKLGKGRQPNLYCANGCSREQLDDAAKNALGSTWTPPPPTDAEAVAIARAAKQAAALRLWNGSTPCTETPTAAYLASRGLERLKASIALRHRGDCWHPERGRYPAMIALVQNVSATAIAVHRTYLTPAGAKACVDPPKASLGPIWGGMVALDPVAPEMVIGEGIETSASAGVLMNLPALAALSAGNLAAGVVLPARIRNVVIASDHDGPGRKAALDACSRWRTEGRTVRIATPDRPGQDFNDLLMERHDA